MSLKHAYLLSLERDHPHFPGLFTIQTFLKNNLEPGQSVSCWEDMQKHKRAMKNLVNILLSTCFAFISPINCLLSIHLFALNVTWLWIHLCLLATSNRKVCILSLFFLYSTLFLSDLLTVVCRYTTIIKIAITT